MELFSVKDLCVKIKMAGRIEKSRKVMQVIKAQVSYLRYIKDEA